MKYFIFYFRSIKAGETTTVQRIYSTDSEMPVTLLGRLAACAYYPEKCKEFSGTFFFEEIDQPESIKFLHAEQIEKMAFDRLSSQHQSYSV